MLVKALFINMQFLPPQGAPDYRSEVWVDNSCIHILVMVWLNMATKTVLGLGHKRDLYAGKWDVKIPRIQELYMI